MKIRTKIAVAFTAMTALIILMLSFFVYVVSLRHAQGFFFTRLKVRASIAAESYLEGERSQIQQLRVRHLEKLPDEREFVFPADTSFSRNVVARFPQIPTHFINQLIVSDSAQAERGFQHYVGRRLRSQRGAHPEYFIIATAYDESGAENLTFLRTMMLIGFATSTILVFGLGQLFANRIMQPVSNIISKVHDITKTNLSDRLQVTDGKDEIAEMAITFNSMLDQLETTFELQRNFIGNASHELNTPLTAILGESEIILKSPRTTDEYVQSLARIHLEAHKLHDVTASLLRLSSISYEGKKQKIDLIPLDQLLLEIKFNLDRRIPANHVKLLFQNMDEKANGLTVIGSDIWLELAITNVIQNSIKYSDNKEVLVTLSSDDTSAFIEISDKGIGIPDDEMRYVFEPFFRARNTSSYKGYGIGLPLAARIVKLHAGELNIFSKPSIGTKVSIRFPLKSL